jgi:uncharacterized protein involved in cysteine biosynthesis
VLSSLVNAFAQVSDPAFRRVIVRGAVAAIVLFIVLVAGITWGLEHVAITGIGWLNQAIASIGGIGAVILAGILFPGAMVAVQGFLLDDAADAVETRHYPSEKGKAVSLKSSVVSSLRLAGITIVLNILALPLYFWPAVNVIVFYGLNGYLLGREYFELVALRHMEFAAARALRRRNRGAVFIAGIVVAFLFTVPLLGWFMPAFATAFMVHVYETTRQRRAA